MDLHCSGASVRKQFHNDLEQAAVAAVPGLSEWRELLDGRGAHHWRLSGSGSSFFGLYDDERRANNDLEEIVREAERGGLGVRGRWVTAPAAAGIRLRPDQGR